MTATDELRALLDERGIEWGSIREDESESDYLTEWQFDGKQGRAIAIEWAVGSGLSIGIQRYHLTPEQAVEATLERETCNNISNPPNGFLCSKCRWGDFAEPSHLLTTAKYTNNNKGPNYCPNCGRRVVGE